MEQNKNDEIEIDLREIFQLLLSRAWLILLVGFIFAAGTGIFCKFVATPIYSSTTKLCIVGSNTTLTSLADLQLGTQLTQDYIVVAQSRPVVEDVIKNLDLDMTYEELLAVTTISNPADTRMLEITVTNPDPYLAKQIVDQYAQVSKKRIADLMDIGEPKVAEEGYVAEDKTSPTTGKNTVIAAFLGVFLAAGIVVIRFIMDDTIKSSEDIERYLGLNTLGVLPLEEAGLKEETREKERDRKYKKEKKKNKGKGAA